MTIQPGQPGEEQGTHTGRDPGGASTAGPDAADAAGPAAGTSEAGTPEARPQDAGDRGSREEPGDAAPGGTAPGTPEAPRSGVPSRTDAVATPAQPMGAIDWIYGVLFRPRETFDLLARTERPPLGLAVTVAVVLQVVGGLVTGASLASEFASGPALPFGGDAGLPEAGSLDPALAGALFGVFGAFLGLIFWFGQAAVYHLVSDMLGGRGDGRRLLAALGLATVPQALTVPVEALAARLGIAGEALRVVASLGVVLWSLYLTYRGVRATKQLSRSGALLTVFLPIVGAVVLALALLLVLIIVFVVAAA